MQHRGMLSGELYTTNDGFVLKLIEFMLKLMEFQARAVQHLTQRVERALGWAIDKANTAGDGKLQGMVVAGGVAANKAVRESLTSAAGRRDITMYCPPPRLCVDNGVMVAWSGVERLALGLWEEPPQDM